MLTIKKVSKDKRGGMPRYLCATEYYRDKDGHDRSSAQWFGEGARELGLLGKSVELDTMNKLADGFAPDGRELRQNAGAVAQRRKVLDRHGNVRKDKNGCDLETTIAPRVGFDLTFSAPKSVSIAFAGSDGELRDRILQAHHAAVEKSLRYIEQAAAETRRGKAGKDVIEAKGMVISRHTHYAARAHDKGFDEGKTIDADLHTHCLTYNVCRGDDGKWSSLEPREIYRIHRAVGAMYRAELSHNLERLGFGIEEDLRHDKDGKVKDRFFRIAGVPKELEEEMSGRRKQILEHMKEHGVSAHEANLATRTSKDEPSFPELIQSWQNALAQYRGRNPELPRGFRDLLGRQGEKNEITVRERDEEIIQALHENKSVWTKADLMGQIASRGPKSIEEVKREADEFLDRHKMVEIEPEKIHQADCGNHLARRYRETRYADARVVETEKNIVRDAALRKGEQEIHLKPETVMRAMDEMEKERGITLSQEQRRAVAFATTETGGIAVIQGHAGTGKTTCTDAIVRAYEREGRHVVGCATGWDAAKKLQAESKIESHSIAALIRKLDTGKLRLDARSFLLVDEAGMVGTPSLARLLGHANQAKAKVLLQGDVLQLQAVERGSPMRLLAKELGSADITDIRRQRHLHDRDTAKLFYQVGNHELRSFKQNEQAGQQILLRMEQRGQIQGYDTREEAMRTLVNDYMASRLPMREKLIIAGTRDDVSALSRMVRDARKSQGELQGERTIAVQNQRGIYEELSIAPGERIRFGRKDEKLGLVNGTRAVVDGLDGHKLHVTLESEIEAQGGRKLEVDLRSYSTLAHDYASTVHKAQGQGCEEVYHLSHKGMTDRQLSLVSFTRAKDSYALYGRADELYGHSTDAKLVQDRLQLNALEEGVRKPHQLKRKPIFEHQIEHEHEHKREGTLSL